MTNLHLKVTDPGPQGCRCPAEPGPNLGPGTCPRPLVCLEAAGGVGGLAAVHRDWRRDSREPHCLFLTLGDVKHA